MGRKQSPVKVIYADGSSKMVKSGHFGKPKSHAILRGYRRRRHWKELRCRALEREGHACKICRRKDVRLECHHLTYVRLGRERLEDVVIICQRCHATEHHWKRVNGRGLSFAED